MLVGQLDEDAFDREQHRCGDNQQGFKGAAGRLVTAGLADSRDTQIPGG